MATRRSHVWIRGRVQGVFFRASVQEEASKRGLKGWVRNLSDGRVEAVFEGDDKEVEGMLSWCHSGSPLSRVDHVDIQEEPFRGEPEKFEIRY